VSGFLTRATCEKQVGGSYLHVQLLLTIGAPVTADFASMAPATQFEPIVVVGRSADGLQICLDSSYTASRR
jgi:hypothetical protein